MDKQESFRDIQVEEQAMDALPEIDDEPYKEALLPNMNKKLATEEEEMEDEMEQSVISSSVVSSYDKTQQRRRCRPNNFYNQ